MNPIGFIHASESINKTIFCMIYDCDKCPLRGRCSDKYNGTITPKYPKYDVFEDREVVEKLTNPVGFTWAPESIVISIVTWCANVSCSECPLRGWCSEDKRNHENTV